jgi:hypothetical protein
MNEYTVHPLNEKPGMVTAIAIMTLVNGILNIFWGLGLTAAVVFGTLFIGIICAPITILPSVLGIFEVIYALKLLNNPPQPVQPSQAIAILEIVCILAGNVLSAVVGILVLVFYNDPQVKAYFEMLNSSPMPAPQPVKPIGPVAPAKPEPTEPEATPAPDSTEEAPKPKRRKSKSGSSSS